MKINRWIVVSIFVFLCSCKQKNEQRCYSVDKTINTKLITTKMSKFGVFDLKHGFIDITTQYLLNDSVDIIFSTGYNNIYVYKSNDSLFFNFVIEFGKVYGLINASSYSLKVKYMSRKTGYFETKDDNGTSFAPSVSFSKLILNKEKYNIGDTIRGYIYFKTKGYKHANKTKIDIYSGHFMSIIITKEVFDTIPSYDFL